MKRPAQPEEIALAGFVYFASEVDLSYVNGGSLNVTRRRTTTA